MANKHLLPIARRHELLKRLMANPERLRKVMEASQRWRRALHRYIVRDEQTLVKEK